jgi:hypothetical protein
MEIIYTDQEIAELIQERKILPGDWRTQLYQNESLIVSGVAGNTFRIIISRNPSISLDFSVILAILVPQSNKTFRLRRYNGWTNPHTNRIERNEVRGFHIHFATERYQLRGQKEDSYAKETDRYSNFDGAVDCLIADANFELPPQSELELF